MAVDASKRTDGRRVTYRRYIFPGFLLLHIGIMFALSSLYHSTIFDPMQFLWAFMFFIGGPILIFAAICVIILRIRGRTLAGITLATAILCLLLIPPFSLGFWEMGRVMRPIMFSIVKNSNEHMAKQFMVTTKENVMAELWGFRYPLCRLGTPIRAVHSNDVFVLVLPSGPGPKDRIIYDPRKRTTHDLDERLAEGWYLKPALEVLS